MASSAAAAAAVAATSCRLRVLSFNLLAPSARICPPLHNVPWQHRCGAICDLVIRLQPDVLALQEWCFVTTGFEALFSDKLCSKYDRYTKRRTGGKPEGLALLLRKGVFENVEVDPLELDRAPTCKRVAIVAEMRHRASRQQLVVATTHLTVAHADNNYDIPKNRPVQMAQVLEELEKRAESCGATAAFLLGDLNADYLEDEPPSPNPFCYSARDLNLPVQMVFDHGFKSALHSKLGEHGPRPCSHHCSYAMDGNADYIFSRCAKEGVARLDDAYLFPRDLPPDTPWDDDAGWGSETDTLSDHRPLLADFHLHPSAGSRC